jgi:hypothetical protein
MNCTTLCLWLLFLLGHTLHVLKRASLSKQSALSGTRTRLDWLRANAVNLAIRLLVNGVAFSYWITHPQVGVRFASAFGIPLDLSLAPSPAAAAMFGLAGDTLVDWAAAKVPALQKEIPPDAPATL